MGKLVNVVLPSGKVVSVPEELANKINQTTIAHTEDSNSAAAREVGTLNEERSAGLGEGIKASVEGFADAATFGGYGALKAYGDPEAGRNAQIRAQERPGARLAGELATVVLPSGVLGDAGKAIGEALPINSIAGVAGKAGGRLAEGAVYGIGGNLAASNVTGDPVSIEGLVQSAGIGAILNYGIGKISDGILGKSKRATEALAEEEKSSKLSDFFTSKPETYNELVATHKANISAAKATQREYDKAVQKYAEDYHEFTVDPKNVKSAINDLGTLELNITSQLRAKAKGDFYPLKDNGSVEVVPTTQPIRRKIGESAPEYTTDRSVKGPTTNPTPLKDTATPRYPRDASTVPPIRTYTDTGSLTPQEVSALEQAKRVIGETKTKALKAIREGKQSDALIHLDNGIKQAKDFLPEAEYPDIPSLSPKFHGSRPTVPEGTLPGTVKGFASLDPRTVAKIANSVEAGTPLAEAVDKFTVDIGMTMGATPAETLAGIHAGLKNSLKSFASREIESGGMPNLLDVLKGSSRKALRYAFGRVADRSAGGGFIGSAARTMTGAAVGYGLDGVEGAVIGAQLLSGKSTIRENTGSLFAKYGSRAASGLTKLAPVTSFLSTSFPSGEKDSETDIRKLALNRTRDLQSSMHLATDASFSALQPLMNAPGDIAYKMHEVINNAVAYMTNAAPRDPGVATNMFNSYWKPTHSEALRLASVMEAVLAPMQAIQRLIQGSGHPEAADALWSNWPAHMQEASSAMVENAAALGNLTREQSSALGRCFRVPLNGFQQPEVAMQLQSLFLPKPSEQSSAGSSKSPGVNGRPPAISNQRNPNSTLINQLQRN